MLNFSRMNTFIFLRTLEISGRICKRHSLASRGKQWRHICDRLPINKAVKNPNLAKARCHGSKQKLPTDPKIYVTSPRKPQRYIEQRQDKMTYNRQSLGYMTPRNRSQHQKARESSINLSLQRSGIAPPVTLSPSSRTRENIRHFVAVAFSKSVSNMSPACCGVEVCRKCI